MRRRFYIRKVSPPIECVEDGILDCLDCPDKLCRYDKKNKYFDLWNLAIKLEKYCQSQSVKDVVNILNQIEDWTKKHTGELKNEQ